jgi:hypothetical protein
MGSFRAIPSGRLQLGSERVGHGMTRFSIDSAFALGQRVAEHLKSNLGGHAAHDNGRESASGRFAGRIQKRGLSSERRPRVVC